MQIIDHPQGSAAWHAYRATAKNASDAPAMLGISPYKTRTALVQERASGISPEVTPEQQRIFDRGHHFEALARPLAEKLIFDDLSPCVGTDGTYSASFDGITFGGDIVFEHKTLNDTLRAVMQNGCKGADLPEHYRAQMEQQAMVSGCERILFMASRFDANDLPVEVLHCWYTPDPVMRARLIAGWAQFDKDVAAWQPTETAAPAVATPQESLPAVVVQVQGALTIAGNLPAFGQALRSFIERIPARPSTDQEFADADAACKALKKAEDALTQAEDGALAQISDVELMRRTVADLRNLARSTRLATEKLVAAEKEARKLALVQSAQASLMGHITEANGALYSKDAGYIQPPAPGHFAPCIKGLKSLDSMRERITAELLAEQALINHRRDKLLANRASLHRDGADWVFLFPDFSIAGAKDAEDFEALFIFRQAQHEKHMAQERQAKLEQRAQQAAQPAQNTSAAPATCKPDLPVDPGKTLTLGLINERLHPIRIDAAGLAELGFEPVARDKSAKLYRASDFAAMCRAIARVAMAATQPQEA